jgi:hypothetical protein
MSAALIAQLESGDRMNKFAFCLALILAGIGGTASSYADDDADRAIMKCVAASGGGPGRLVFTNSCATTVRVFYKLRGTTGSSVMDLAPSGSRTIDFGAGGDADWVVCRPTQTAYENRTNSLWTGLSGHHTCK